MGTEVYVVVGDEYREFANHTGVVTASQALETLRGEPSSMKGVSLLVGQGIDRATRLALERAALGAKANVKPTLGDTPLALTHKANEHAVLISTPAKVADACYRAELTVGDQVDRLSDHVTGQHVAGMVLVEGARQLGIAALELEYGGPGGMPYGLAWGALNARFLAYAFPVPTDVSVRLTEDPNKGKRGQLTVKLEFELRQCSIAVAEIVMETSLIEKASLKKIEARRASQIVEKFRAQSSSASASAAPAEWAGPVA